MKLKRKLLALSLPVVFISSTAGTALASTVYYRGTAVYWDHGNIGKVRSYSNVQSHHYTHSSTANGVWSHWKRKGTMAKAATWITPGTRAEAYWDCK
ncbi:hypothetical protein J2Z60_002002 [Lactobacillus colini]|uniref:Lactococcin 972 family bacteriocin n=1 Tax=Lactobacillus colini TaxID=1819254 RepID=A0ABS4MGH9_9LACO|nr:hypothetical protein [Lactobacillus colini]MBP2058811.1 hypothetical protein [Lactobacillus colini]